MRTTLISVSTGGRQGNGRSGGARISKTGRYVVFTSDSTNLVDNDANRVSDIFLRDTTSGTTTLLSTDTPVLTTVDDVTTVTANQGNAASLNPSISNDGGYIVFESDATNLVTGDTNNYRDVFLRNLVTNTTTRLSVSTSGTQANHDCKNVAISGNSRYAVFTSGADNLVDTDTNQNADLFRRDITSGTTTLISLNSGGVQHNGSFIGPPSISDDGRYVVFASDATNLVANDVNGRADVFLRDTVTNTTTRISISSYGMEANGWSFDPKISGDGRWVTYVSAATNLTTIGRYVRSDNVFLYDTKYGNTKMLSMGPTLVSGQSDSRSPAISGDGRSIAFESEAANLSDPGADPDTNYGPDIYFTVTTGPAGGSPLVRLAKATSGGQADRWAYAPSLSGDGRYVVFESSSTNLVAGDSNGERQIFLTDRLGSSSAPPAAAAASRAYSQRAGTAGPDMLIGAAGRDSMFGGDGDDILFGDAGADWMGGGNGDDTYYVDIAQDVVIEKVDSGTDTVVSSITYTLATHIENLELTGTRALRGTGNARDNVLTGNTGSNVLIGNAGDDTLDGGAGNDTLNGGQGDDTLIGAAGNDVFFVDRLGDVVIEGENQGTDTVRSAVGYTLTDSVENLELLGKAAINGTGNALNNLLTGNAGRNILEGGDGDDDLRGGAGNDTLIGGTGNDVLRGGQGRDRFIFEANAGADTLYGFEAARGGGDRIDLSAAGVTAFDQLRLTASNANTVIAYGDADATLTLMGIRPRQLTKADFVFAP